MHLEDSGISEDSIIFAVNGLTADEDPTLDGLRQLASSVIEAGVDSIDATAQVSAAMVANPERPLESARAALTNLLLKLTSTSDEPGEVAQLLAGADCSGLSL